MKNLIYFFLLFSTVVSSQNYNYAIDEPQKTAKPTGVNNQPEEIAYFNAYLLPLSQKANLQKALDTYGAVRLEKGDYRGISIVMRSGQKLYGNPAMSIVSPITIAAGSSDVYIGNVVLADKAITFQAGGVISNCTIKTIKSGTISAINAKLENNNFIDIIGVITLDCSVFGYFRNTKIIKHQAQTNVVNLVMKGNNTTPSYGNVNLHSNYLTPLGDVTDIDNLQSATFVGVDSEGWNLTGAGTKAMFTAKNIGNLKITDLGGANWYSTGQTPAFDIDATNLFMLNRKINNDPVSVLSPRTNMFMVDASDIYSRSGGAIAGYDLLAHVNNNDISYNSTIQSTLIADPTLSNALTSRILGTQYTPWARPKWENLPDPLGPNWKADRIGKPDQTAYIQNLISSNGIAELPEGVFYIGSTLNVPLDNNHGIIGKGTGKTVIVGLTDDFPLITIGYGSSQNFVISNLTLQGGKVGLYAGNYNTQLAFQNMKFVTFRDQNYGIQLHQIFGLDNNFFDHLGFVNCIKGFFQDPLTPSTTDYGVSSYVDKTVFYESQFRNCETAISMLATRADNLDAWINCKFDGGSKAMDLAGNNFAIVANCDFTNITGANIIKTNTISIYSSYFYGNTTTDATINSPATFVEGCNFLDSISLFSPVIYNPVNSYIINSTITGNVLPTIPTGGLYGAATGVYMNSNLLANPTLSKMLVNIKGGTTAVLLNAAPNPYPQLLVTQ